MKDIGSRFLVIGRAGLDLYADPPGTPIEVAERFTSALGGSSANIAAALTRQGAQAAILTCVSDDAVGRHVLAQLDRYGIDRSLVRIVGGEARNTLAVVDTNGDATQAVIYRNGAADFEMGQVDVDRADLSAFDALVTTGTVLAAEPARSAAMAAFARARAAGLSVVFDIDYRPYSWTSANEAQQVIAAAADLSDIVVGNDVEFGFLAGAPESGLAAARVLGAQGKLAIYKRGALGAVTFAEGREFSTGIFPTDALKPTGAGDAFLGSFLAARATGHAVDASVRRGSAAAAMVVAEVACAPAMPSAEALTRFLEDHPGATVPTDPE